MSATGRLRWILLAGVLTLSALLVWGAFVPAPHNGGDNAAYLSLAHAWLHGEGYVDAYDPVRAPHTKYPPVFPLLLAAVMALGAVTWVPFKLVAALATVLSVGAAFLWAERRVGAWTAGAVAALFAASAGVVYYSHWVLSDPVFVLLVVGAWWAFERAGGRAETGDARGEAAGAGEGAADTRDRPLDARWWAAGVALALGAYFTRSAGLPLLVAACLWLLLGRRFRVLAWTAGAFAAPALWWWARGRGAGVGDYVTEFWLVDPYQPALGTVGIGGLLARAAGNAVAYVVRHLPAAVVGPQGGWAALLGVAIVAAAAWGWGRRVRRGASVPELFLPLYLGLILLWPEVWGGDRFLLPVLPLLLLYGAETVRDVAGRMGGAGRVLSAAAVLALLLPALGHWVGSARDARGCAAVVDVAGPWGCYGPRVGAFVTAAAWAGTELPEGSAVLTRKPRIFHLMSAGVPSRTFPFDPDPDVLLAEADAVGARYVLLDRWDGQAARFVGAAVAQRPGAFCFVVGFGAEGSDGVAQLLGILPPEARGPRVAGGPDGVSVGRCGPEYLAPGDGARPTYSASSPDIPLLVRPTP